MAACCFCGAPREVIQSSIVSSCLSDGRPFLGDADGNASICHVVSDSGLAATNTNRGELDCSQLWSLSPHTTTPPEIVSSYSANTARAVVFCYRNGAWGRPYARADLSWFVRYSCYGGTPSCNRDGQCQHRPCGIGIYRTHARDDCRRRASCLAGLSVSGTQICIAELVQSRSHLGIEPRHRRGHIVGFQPLAKLEVLQRNPSPQLCIAAAGQLASHARVPSAQIYCIITAGWGDI